MISIKKILVPTDFSDASVPAYTHAQELARRFGARIDLIHIVPVLHYFAESIKKLGVPFDMETDLYPHVRDGAEQQLKSLMDDYVAGENKGNVHILIDRKPSRAISDFAEQQGYDLIVMAAKGGDDSPMSRGGTTEKTIRHSKVPVFTVDNRLKADGLKRILLPTDRSPVSFSCLPIVLALAEAYEAEIILFFVLELYGAYPGDPGDDPRRLESSEMSSDLFERLEQSLAGKAELESTGESTASIRLKGAEGKMIPVTTVIEEGVSAHHKIETYAPGHSDLVIMTTHGFSGLAHFFLGSTTEKVVQHLNMPVLTVKPSEQEMGAGS